VRGVIICPDGGTLVDDVTQNHTGDLLTGISAGGATLNTTKGNGTATSPPTPTPAPPMSPRPAPVVPPQVRQVNMSTGSPVCRALPSPPPGPPPAHRGWAFVLVSA